MIQLEPEHYRIVSDILSKYSYDFYVYGSRAKNNAKPLSDLDLCSKAEIPLNIMAHINEDFENSHLPFKVEIVVWGRLSKEFQDLIKKDLIPFELYQTQTTSKGGYQRF